MFGVSCFWLETMIIIKIKSHSFYPIICAWFWWGWSKKKCTFLKKKIQNGWLKKTTFFKTVNSQYFFAKLSGIGPWVSRINWCEGHQCDSTDMVVRLSNIRPKTGKKCIFCVFWPFLSLCRTASRPHRLSHIAALRINNFF